MGSPVRDLPARLPMRGSLPPDCRPTKTDPATAAVAELLSVKNRTEGLLYSVTCRSTSNGSKDSNGSVAASGPRNLNDWCQSDPAVGAWPLKSFVWLAAPAHKRSLSFRGRLTATDPEQTVESLQGGHSPHAATNGKPPFVTQECYSCAIGSFEEEAVSGCRMVVVGSRPSAAVAPPKNRAARTAGN